MYEMNSCGINSSIVHAGCAKGAIDYMTKHMCTEWGPNNVRINAIAIGAIADTEGYDRLSGSKDMQREWISKIPLQRIGQKDDIARSCVFLASDAASYMTGSILTVDGMNVIVFLFLTINKVDWV